MKRLITFAAAAFFFPSDSIQAEEAEVPRKARVVHSEKKYPIRYVTVDTSTNYCIRTIQAPSGTNFIIRVIDK